MTVLKLASSQERVPARPCSTCRFYHPDVSTFGMDRVTWSLWPFGRRVERVPDSRSHRFAICSAFGGNPANQERSEQGRCKAEGKSYERSESL